MLRGQTLVASDGYEVALFPCEAMYLTPARDPAEHDVLALDFLPRTITGQVITGMRCYAPFSGTIVYTGNDHNCILESDNVVHIADGRLVKARVLVAHSFIPPVRGTHYNQGDEFYITGNYGQSYGEHLHMEVALAEGSYWNPGGIGLYSAIHMWNMFYVNNTELLRTGGFDWKTWDAPTPPIISGTSHKFPWFIINRKRRIKTNV